MNRLGSVYQEDGKDPRAEPLLKQALEIRLRRLGLLHFESVLITPAPQLSGTGIVVLRGVIRL